jgi:hypothetical protein
MSDSTTIRRAAKAWRLRNSDGRHSWGDERMSEESKRIQAPPAFTLTDVELPPGTVRLANPDDDNDGRAVRHTHAWSVEEPA